MGKKILITVMVLALVAAASFFGVQMYANNAVAKEVDALAEKTADSFELTYGSAKADIFNKAAYISDVTITPVAEGSEPSHINTVVIHDIDLDNEFPTYMNIAFKGMDVDMEALGERGAALKAMGYDKLKSNLEIDYRYDVAGKELFLNKISNGIDEFGVLTFSTHLSSIDLSGGPMALLFTFPTIVIHSAEASFTDDSFMGRLMDLVSQSRGIEVDELKVGIFETLDAEIENAPDDTSRELLSAVRTFIEKPDRITISINPPEPVAFMALQEVDKAAIPGILNIKVTN